MKLRISKTVQIFLAVGGFVIVLIALGMIYRGQVDERTQLEARLDTIQKMESSFQLDHLTTKQEDLTAQLAQLDEQNAQAESRLNCSTDEIRISDTLDQMALNNQLFLSGLRTVSGGQDTIEKVRFDTLTMNIEALGEMSNLEQFVLDIIKQFPTGVIKSVNIRAATDGAGEFNASIVLVIYSYKGS